MTAYRPSAGNVLRNTFWLWFDNLGKAVVFNCLFILTAIPLVTLPASFGALMHTARLLIERKEAGIADYFTGFARTGIRFTLLYTCAVIFFGICAVDIFFYLRTPSFVSTVLNSWVVIAALFGCLLLLYIPTLLIVHRGRGILKIAAAIILSNFLFSLKTFLLAAVVELVFLLAALPVFFGMFSFLAIFLHFTYMEAAERYTGKQPQYARDRSVVKEFLIPPQK